MLVGKALVLLFVANKIMCKNTFRIFREVLCQCPISLLHLTRTEQLVQTSERLTGARKDNHSADRAVQTMHNPKKNGSWLSVLLLNIQFHRLGERGIASFVALDNFACALRDDDQVIIFVKNFQLLSRYSELFYIFMPPSIWIT